MRDLNPDSPAWCPGCGNYGILPTLDKAIEEAGIDRREVAGIVRSVTYRARKV